MGIFQVILPELSGDELFDSVALEAKTKAMSAEGIRYIAIDLSPLDYIYSDTINKIIGINRSLLPLSGRMVIVAPHEKVFSILNLAGVDKQVKVVRSLDELEILSQLIIDSMPDVKAKPVEIKEEIAEEELDDFSDLKDILSQSLTIGDDISEETAVPPVTQKETPVTTPSEHPEEIIIEDIFVEEKQPVQMPKIEPVPVIGDKIEIKPEQVLQPEQEEKLFDVTPIEISPKPQQTPVYSQQPVQPKPAVSAPVPSNLVIQNEAAKPAATAAKILFDESEDTFKPQKKTDFMKIVLILIILLLIAVVFMLATGGISENRSGQPISEEPKELVVEEIVAEEQVVEEEAVALEPAPVAPVRKTPAKQQTKKTAAKSKPKQAVSSDVIVISTTPSGALIRVNGDYIGKSPQNITRPPYGTIVVSAEMSGFETHEWNINYDGGKRQLTKSLVRVSTSPQPAQVQQQPVAQQQNQQQEAQHRAAAEQAARDEALRQQQLQQQQLAQQQEAQRQIAAEQAARDQAARDEASRQQQQLAAQQEAQRRAAAEQAARDEAARKAAQEQAAQQEIQRKAAAEQAAREEAARKAAEEEAARKAAAEAAQEAEIFFNSMPPRAEIFWNGQKIGETNIAPVKIKPGTYNFEFRKDGKSGTWSGTLRNGKNSSALIRLQ